MGIEFKCEDAPGTTKSIRAAIQDLRLAKVFVVYPGKKDYSLDKNVKVVSIQKIETIPAFI